jgi:hypothetical protein
MLDHRSYPIGARSKSASFHSAADCNDDDAMIAARPLLAASVSTEIWLLARMVVTPVRSHQRATRNVGFDQGTEWTQKIPTSRNSKASDDARVGSADKAKG